MRDEKKIALNIEIENIIIRGEEKTISFFFHFQKGKIISTTSKKTK